MLKLTLDRGKTLPLRILCLGSHCDDLEIGCGGTILQLIEEYGKVDIQWVIFNSDEEREREARVSADKFLSGVDEPVILIFDYSDGYFPYIGSKIKDRFENLKKDVQPDLIFTHFRHDLHQDHRLINELTWNTFRDHLILEYEIPKYDGDLGQPNFFVHISGSNMDRKIGILMNSFQSQREKPWFSEEAFRSLARIRGIESNSPSGYAEGFHIKKAIM